MARVYISIGSNIEVAINIPSSVKALSEHFGELDISSVYETKAVGFDGDDFHNLVVGFDSDESPLEISKVLKPVSYTHLTLPTTPYV